MGSNTVVGILAALVIIVGGGVFVMARTRQSQELVERDRIAEQERQERAARDAAEARAREAQLHDPEPAAAARAAAEQHAHDEAGFAAMSPAAHLEAARAAARAADFAMAQRHLDAVSTGRGQPADARAARREIHDAAVQARHATADLFRQTLVAAHVAFTAVTLEGDDHDTLQTMSPACSADFPVRFGAGESGSSLRRVGIRRIECVLPSGDVFGRGLAD